MGSGRREADAADIRQALRLYKRACAGPGRGVGCGGRCVGLMLEMTAEGLPFPSPFRARGLLNRHERRRRFIQMLNSATIYNVKRDISREVGGSTRPRLAGASMQTLDSSGSRQPQCFEFTALLLIASRCRPPRSRRKKPKPDTVQVHGKPLTLSCAEWKRNQDGSWTSTGPLLVGTDTVNSVTLRGAKEHERPGSEVRGAGRSHQPLSRSAN